MYLIRRAKLSDAEEIQRINHRNLPERYSLSFIEHLLTREGSSYVVEHEGRLVGYAIAVVEKRAYVKYAHLQGSIGHLVSIAVEKKHRRKGLARRMLLKIIEDLRGIVEAIILEVRVTNEPAIRLYSSLGFTVSYIWPGYYRDGETAFIMTYRYG